MCNTSSPRILCPRQSTQMHSFSPASISNMVWCTYCGQAFKRTEHLDRHVLTHTNIKPFKCTTCHFSFKRKDLLQRHHVLIHKEFEEHCSNQENGGIQRRPIACVACARAKTKCDKAIPSCTRCISKGLACEARSTKRSNDAAYRLARRQLSSYQRPLTIASAENRSDTPSKSSAGFLDPSFSYTTPEVSMSYSSPPRHTPQRLVYQQLSLTPPIAVAPSPMAPQDHLMLPVSGGSECFPYSSNTSAPALDGNQRPGLSELQLPSPSMHHVFGEGGLYPGNMEVAQTDAFVGAETEFSYYPGLDYSRMSVPSVDYESLSFVQECTLNSARPSRSSSLHSSKSGTW